MRVVIYKIPQQEKVLYNLGKLLEKIFKNHQIGVLCNESNIEFVDKTLWTFSSDVFIPHDIDCNDETENKKNPILLSCDLNKIVRDVLCVFTLEDLEKILSDEFNFKNNINTLIYITQEENDVLKIKHSTNCNVDVFVKNKNKWEKTIM